MTVAVEMQEMVARLQNPLECMNLIFMHEYSKILTHTSKHSQDTEHLPPTRKQEIDKLLKRLQLAQEAFQNRKCPDEITISWSEQVI